MLPVTLSPILYAQPILKFRQLPGFAAGLAARAVRDVALAAGIAFLLVLLVARITVWGQGYLAPLGFAMAMLVLDNVLAKTGWAPWFPWSIVRPLIGMVGPSAQTLPPTQATEPAEETVRNVAWNSLYPLGGIPRLPTAAFAQWGKKNGLAQPLTKEVRFSASGKVDASGPFIMQGYDGSPGVILYCRFGEWDKIKPVGWL